MSLRYFTNQFGGDSLLVSRGAALDDVPSPFKELLTNDVCAAFLNPSSYFSSLASQCMIGKMRTWLERLAEADSCDIEINTSRFCEAVVIKVAGFQLSLQEHLQLPPSGKALEKLYSLILRTWHSGFPNAGGLHEPETVEYQKLMIISDIDIPPDAVNFYTTPCGDSLLASGDDAYWYSHEGADEVLAGTVVDVLSIYFEHLLRGTVHKFEFPY